MELLIIFAILLLIGVVIWYLNRDKTVEQVEVQKTHDNASKSAIVSKDPAEAFAEAVKRSPPPPPPMRSLGGRSASPAASRTPSASTKFSAPYGGSSTRQSDNGGISLTDVVVAGLVLDALTDDAKADPAPVETPREPDPAPTYVEPETTRYEPPASTSYDAPSSTDYSSSSSSSYGSDNSSSSWSSSDDSSSSNNDSSSSSFD